MDTSLILTFFTPALMLLFIGVSTRFFAPSLGKSFIIKSPDWWSRDQKTWDKAQLFLAQKYLMYGAVLAVYCGTILYLNRVNLSVVAYILFLLFFGLANYQARKYMGKG